MISRTATVNETQSTAVYSDCERYRYALTRSWDETGRKLVFIMLNPSTADETRNDPTLERCERRARAMGYGAFRVVNLFAWRATDPKDLKASDAPEGPDNMSVLQDACDWADSVIAGWGVHGAHLGQGPRIAGLLNTPLTHLGLTKDGHPRHPLYVSYAVLPSPWAQPDASENDYPTC